MIISNKNKTDMGSVSRMNDYPYPSGEGERERVSTGWLEDYLEDDNLTKLLKWYFGFLNVKNYIGSFMEWSSYPKTPQLSEKSVLKLSKKLENRLV